jgi:hypothetical protein
MRHAHKKKETGAKARWVLDVVNVEAATGARRFTHALKGIE